MPVLITDMNHDWVRVQLMEILNLPIDGDLEPDDFVGDPDLGEAEGLFEAYYPDTIRRDRVSDIYDYTKVITGRVAPRFLKASTLKMLLNFEWLAHMQIKVKLGSDLPKLYRDHVLHPANVCAVGWWLMSDQGPEPLRLENIATLLEGQYGSTYHGQDWKDLTQRAWVLASLNHDILYPIEFLESLNCDENIIKHTTWEKKRLARSQVHRIFEGAKIGIFQDQTSKSGLEAMIRSVKRSHAPLSGLYLIGPDSGYADTSERRKIIHELAASAVLHHHSESPVDIDYHLRPLGYLLALADECHEFGREMAFWKGESNVCEVKFIPPITSSDITNNDSDFTITFYLNGPDEIQALEQQGFDRAMYVTKKEGSFERFNPLVSPSGDYQNGFSFQAKVQ